MKTKIKETGMTVDLSKEYEKSELIQILSNRDRPANSRYGSLRVQFYKLKSYDVYHLYVYVRHMTFVSRHVNPLSIIIKHKIAARITITTIQNVHLQFSWATINCWAICQIKHCLPLFLVSSLFHFSLHGSSCLQKLQYGHGRSQIRLRMVCIKP